MKNQKQINFAVIGGGLMGKEFASAISRWCCLENVDFQPRITGICSLVEAERQWFKDRIPTVKIATEDYKQILASSQVDAVYCAVPHNLHADFYTDIIQSGKHLLGEKPFGIDLQANQRISAAVSKHSDLLVRCVSQMPFFPGGQLIAQWAKEGKFGRIIEVQSGFLHASDLNPDKPINWKRKIAVNGEYGCMGDLGMHAAHLPLRFGWMPDKLTSSLTNIVTTRPNASGQSEPCETWDNAVLTCHVQDKNGEFPLFISTKRIAPGNANTWFIKVYGTQFSAEFTTKNPKQIATLPYTPGGEQAWHVEDLPHKSAYPTVTGGIFEFGFTDAIVQMIAAFCDELANGRQGMSQPFYCATPKEAAQSHQLFTAALQSQKQGNTVKLG